MSVVNGTVNLTGFVRSPVSRMARAALRIPWSFAWPWMGTSPNDMTGFGAAVSGACTSATAWIGAFYRKQVSTGTSFGYFTVHQAFGDDLVLSRFVCMPAITVASWPQ